MALMSLAASLSPAESVQYALINDSFYAKHIDESITLMYTENVF